MKTSKFTVELPACAQSVDVAGVDVVVDSVAPVVPGDDGSAGAVCDDPGKRLVVGGEANAIAIPIPDRTRGRNPIRA
jgi:hypothetical protein